MTNCQHDHKEVKISIIITAHLRERFIIDSVKSVINQTLNRDFYEIIVVKDFLNPVIDEFLAKNNVVVANVDQGLNLGEFIYEGLTRASSDLIAFLDDDDFFEPNKLEYVLDVFSNVNLTFLRHSMYYVDEHGENLRPLRKDTKITRSFKFPLANEHTVLELIRLNADFNSSTMVFKRSILQNNFETLKKIEAGIDEYFFYSALLYGTETLISSDKLSYYRIHNSTVNTIDSFKAFNIKKKQFYKKYADTFALIENMVKDSKLFDFPHCQFLYSKMTLSLFTDLDLNSDNFKRYLNCILNSNRTYDYRPLIAAVMNKLIPRLPAFIFYIVSKIIFS